MCVCVGVYAYQYAYTFCLREKGSKRNWCDDLEATAQNE